LNYNVALVALAVAPRSVELLRAAEMVMYLVLVLVE
jgi:hypothetical protein